MIFEPEEAAGSSASCTCSLVRSEAKKGSPGEEKYGFILYVSPHCKKLGRQRFPTIISKIT